MSDFEKIMAITRRAKENASRAAVSNITTCLLGMADMWLDFKWIDSLFPDHKQRILAYRWYDTVFKMRLPGNGS